MRLFLITTFSCLILCFYGCGGNSDEGTGNNENKIEKSQDSDSSNKPEKEIKPTGRGADPKVNGDDGNNLKDIKRLLSEGADINAEYKNEKTMLQFAVWKNYVKSAEFLIANGADADILKYNCTLLYYVKSKEMAELLIAKGVDVNYKNDSNGFTALYYAIDSNNKKEIIELLIAKGADVNAKTKWDITPLLCAIDRNRKDIVELLIAKGADVNVKDAFGNTPLHYAASENQIEIAELLIAKGADMNIIGKTRDKHVISTALDMAKTEEMKELLRKHGGESCR